MKNLNILRLTPFAFPPFAFPSWEWAQWTKPDETDTPGQYFYEVMRWQDLIRICYYYLRKIKDENGRDITDRDLIFDEDRDTYEIFSFIIGYYVKALGCTSVGQPFTGHEINLSNATYGFTNASNDHSGQFRYSMPEKINFWEKFFAETNIKSLKK